MRQVLGFDVGGSHVAVALCREGDFHLASAASRPHAAIQSCEAFVDLLDELRHEVGAERSGVEGAMLAVPGPFDLEAGVSLMQHKLPYLYGFDLRCALAQRFGVGPRRVRFLNDANAYLLGEVGAGAARGFHRAIGLTLGTGIGSAFAVDGQVVTEGSGVPHDGEIWNLPFEGGTVEDFVSTRAIVDAYERRSGLKREVVEIAGVAENDAAAKAAFDEFGRSLGRVIRNVLGGFSADVIVLGGGIAQSAELFLEATRSELPQTPLKLRVAELGGRAALVGCGVAWFGRTGDNLPTETISTSNDAA